MCAAQESRQLLVVVSGASGCRTWKEVIFYADCVCLKVCVGGADGCAVLLNAYRPFARMLGVLRLETRLMIDGCPEVVWQGLVWYCCVIVGGEPVSLHWGGKLFFARCSTYVGGDGVICATDCLLWSWCYCYYCCVCWRAYRLSWADVCSRFCFTSRPFGARLKHIATENDNDCRLIPDLAK